MYVIDLKTGGTIPFSHFKSEEIARAYAKFQKVNILLGDGTIEGGISEKEAKSYIEIIEKMHKIEVPTEIETKKVRKTRTKKA